MAQQSSLGSPALRFGALAGVGLGILLIANHLLQSATDAGWTVILTIPISLVVYLIAGMLAAQQTGKVSTGLVAGLFAGLFSSLLNNIVAFILFATNHSAVEQERQMLQQQAQQSGVNNLQYTDSLVIVLSAIALTILLVLPVLIGLGMGALGGVIAKSRVPPSPSSYQEMMYPGYPPTPYSAPGYPPYPQGPQPGAYPPSPPVAYPPPPEMYTPGQGNWPQQPPQGDSPQQDNPAQQ
jgi:hypothetical protein